jgi:DNA-binding HxlR family transcriptional regulator
MAQEMSEQSSGGSSDFCPRFHHAIELIGKRWTGAIVRVLICEPRRFNEILSAVPGLSDRLLAERLRELEAENIVERHVEPGPPVRVGYELTASGKELESALRALADWAEKRTARTKRRKSA